MEFSFDKEIDALLRQTAKGEAVSAAADLKSNHLDADEISAYAENALPEKAKQRHTIHLADCDSCRKNLSNVISLNPAENEPALAKEFEITAAPIPWYKRLFAYPNMVYTMGALVLVFSGIIGFIVLQNVNSFKTSEVSQIIEKTPNADKKSSDNAAMPTPEIYPNAAGNTTANANAAMVYSPNSMMANSATKTAPENSNVSAPISNPVAAPPPPKNEPNSQKETLAEKNENSFVLDGASPAETRALSKDKQNKPADKDQKTKQDDEAQSDSSVSARQAEELPKGAVFSSTLRSAKKSATPKNETKTVGGKTFRRADNVWYDTAYNNQPTTNVTRNTDEYKKLDKNVCVIAETLKGTVVVLWKEKAYRIQ